MRAYITDVVDSVAYYIVASVVRDTLAVIIVMIFALDLVEFAVLDENPGRFAEQRFEDTSTTLTVLDEEDKTIRLKV